MKINLKILALFAFSTFVFAQASEKFQNALSFCKEKASSALEFAKNNKKKAALRAATGAYAFYLFKPASMTTTFKNATGFGGGDEFKDTWLVEDKYSVFGFNKNSLVGEKIGEKITSLNNKGFGPLSHVVQNAGQGRWLIFFLAFLADKKIPTN